MLRSCLAMLTLCTALSANDNQWALKDPDKGWSDADLVARYHRNSELQRQWAWRALGAYRFDGTERVLDFGCGDGKLSAQISSIVPRGSVMGVDLSEFMVAFAGRMFPKQDFPNLDYLRVASTDFSGVELAGDVDLVVSFCVFHLVPDPVTVLKNVGRHMKEGASLVMTTPVFEGNKFFEVALAELQQRGWPLPPRSDAEEGFGMHSPEQIRRTLQAAGLKPQNVELVPSSTVFIDKADFKDWCIGTVTANWNIPRDQEDDFFDKVLERYLSVMPEAQGAAGTLRFACDRIDVLATR